MLSRLQLRCSVCSSGRKTAAVVPVLPACASSVVDLASSTAGIAVSRVGLHHHHIASWYPRVNCLGNSSIVVHHNSTVNIFADQSLSPNMTKTVLVAIGRDKA